jgi:hypothetical protein
VGRRGDCVSFHPCDHDVLHAHGRFRAYEQLNYAPVIQERRIK